MKTNKKIPFDNKHVILEKETFDSMNNVINESKKVMELQPKLQTILVMVITSFAFMLIPMIIKLIMRLCKKDFFTKEGLFIAGGTASISVALSWLIVLIIDAKNDGIFSIILSVCLLECLFIAIHSAILFGFYRIVYGDDESNKSKHRYNMQKREKENNK